MQHNTHSWSWAICLSFTTVLSWVIPFECLRGSTAVAAPVPIPIAADDRGDRPPPQMTQWIPRGVREFAESAWHPVMDLLESERTFDFSTMGELVLHHEIDRDNPLQHGWFIEGTWGDDGDDDVPIGVQVLDWNCVTAEAHMYFNGTGTTPNEDTRIYIEEDMQVVEAAIILHNLENGNHLGLRLELAWPNASQDDSDGITIIPLAMPTRVVENPGHEFFENSGLYGNYSEWCDFVLTQEGQWRVEDGWIAECEGLQLCVKGFCNGVDATNGTWSYCEKERNGPLFRDCGEIDLTKPLGIAYNDYQNCKDACNDRYWDCMSDAMGSGGLAGLGALSMLAFLQAVATSKEARICLATGIGFKACLLIVLGISIIWTITKVLKCHRDFNRCEKGCEDAWEAAQQRALDAAIAEQCGVPAP